MGKTLLVVECTEHFNWYERFAGFKLHGKEEIRVEQATFPDISLTSYPSSGNPLVVNLRRAARPLPNTPQDRDRTCTPDFILLRSITRGIKGQDSRNVLLGMIHANVPSVNSLLSAQLVLERPVMFSELRKIQRRVGIDRFPLIAQTYYASHREMLITPDPPFVAKMAHCHAGYGKMKVDDQKQFEDLRSLVAVHGDYVTVEPFIDWDWDGRVQRIGEHYRCFRRRNPNWKGNTGHSMVIEDMELTPEIKLWADECAKAFGGLDILGLDFLHDKHSDRLYILEVNDTAIGLVHKYEDEDMDHMRDLVLMRMAQHYPDHPDHPDPALASSSSTSPSEQDKGKEEGEEKEKEEEKEEEEKESAEESEGARKVITELQSELSLLRSKLARERARVAELEAALAAPKPSILDRIFK
mmetsp:Transcript_18103/g.45954  ORF Transcript_18103/g.45954 Transcript_18103/m.45954 type:complete len:412 (-) Transcript_18103:114-1349(-)|eukprot:CAMPEP_0177659778 /NCGR_PEP_ID=MMETSP0447-20121125/17634_1 /TAXON_ID=0 /ORGANISM="Stygamoeba regulata, Strain BSH-02190019" /LENGTH=411 /DNA_ID=CAMNT_0019164691 /DNA_START=95 /DNA_END=1330 /DNA_ORIENTATION=-